MHSALQALSALPSHNRHKFQGQLKKLLNHILADFPPIPSCLPPAPCLHGEPAQPKGKIRAAAPEVPQKMLQNHLQSFKIKEMGEAAPALAAADLMGG